MTFETDKALAAFKVVDLVGLHAGILSSQFIMLQYSSGKLFMNLTGHAVASTSFPVTGDSGANWTFFLDRRVLGAFLSSTQAKTIDLKMDNTLTLKAGRHRAVVPAMSRVVGYSRWKPDASVKSIKISDELKTEFSMMADYAPITAAADHLSAVYMVKGYGILATDSFCLSALQDSTIAKTFPLPVVLAKLITGSVDTIQIDGGGAGIRFPEGYVYQASSARSQTDYPLEDIKKVVNGALTTKPAVKIPAKRLLEGLAYLNGFVFGSASDVNVELSGKTGEKVIRLSMSSPAGEVHKLLTESEILVPEFSLKWPLLKVLPWVTHIATLDEKISCAVSADHQLLLAGDKKKRVLFIA